MVPIIDTHQHLWDLSKFHLPWLEGAGKLKRSFVMQDYLTASEGLNVIQTVYMEVDVAEEHLVGEAEYVLELCERDDNPMVGAVIGGRVGSPLFRPYIDKFKNNPHLKGVRQVLHSASTPSGTCLEPDFVRNVQYLGECGLRFDLCLPNENLLDGAKLIDLCPHTQFVLDHCGNANVQSQNRSQWHTDIAEVAKRENIVCKISGIIASANPDNWSPEDLAPIILHCAETFGKDRIIFASDWPVCTLTATYRQWVEALKGVVSDWHPTDQKKLFHDNAMRFYALPNAHTV
ncbi:amidohydrolase [Armatimonadota bacterium]|nr:amidohydrolase [Armatimonadota bacterium]